MHAMRQGVVMKFKNQIKRGAGILNRGDRCLYRTMPAVYMGSFKDNEGDVHWNHMLLVQSTINNGVPIIEEFLIITKETRDIVFKKMIAEPLKGQMALC